MRPASRRPRPGRTVAVRLASALAAAALVAGCSSSTWDTSEIDNPSTTKPADYPRDEAGIAASLTAHLSREPGNLNEWSPSAEQAGCVAERLLARLSPERLFELGYEPSKGSLALGFTDEERSAVVNILVGCIDYPAAVVELLSSYEKVPLRVAACVARGVERLGIDRRLAEGLVDGDEPDPFAGDGQLAGGLAELAAECTTQQDLLPNAPLPVMPRSDISDNGDGPGDTAADPSEGSDDSTATTAPAGAPAGGLDLGGGSDGTGSG